MTDHLELVEVTLEQVTSEMSVPLRLEKGSQRIPKVCKVDPGFISFRVTQIVGKDAG